MNDRQIPLEGATNFRDIGGYETVDGKTVKYGKLYRSDELSKLSQQDIQKIQHLGIKVIIDYRNEKERFQNETLDIAGTCTYSLDPLSAMAAAASQKDEELSFAAILKNITEEKALALMLQAYEDFVEDPHCKSAFAEMLSIISHKENQAILQHCRGGKDRTGYGVALILLLLGVPKSTVLEDYLLTNVYRSEKNENSLIHLRKNKEESFVKGMKVLKEARAEFLEKALSIIEAKYGGIQEYVEKELGISKVKMDHLKELYLD